MDFNDLHPSEENWNSSQTAMIMEVRSESVCSDAFIHVGGFWTETEPHRSQSWIQPAAQQGSVLADSCFDQEM